MPSGTHAEYINIYRIIIVTDKLLVHLVTTLLFVYSIHVHALYVLSTHVHWPCCSYTNREDCNATVHLLTCRILLLVCCVCGIVTYRCMQVTELQQIGGVLS